MIRTLRLEYPGAIYHVMNRGDRREDIFKDAEDRRRFQSALGEVCRNDTLPNNGVFVNDLAQLD